MALPILWVQKEYLADLIKRLDLASEAIKPDQLAVLPVVLPVTALDDSFRAGPSITPQLGGGAVSVTGTGSKTLITIPAGKKRKLLSVYASVASGSFTISVIGLSDGTYLHPLISVLSPTVVLTDKFDGGQIVAPAGWTIQVNVAAYTSTGNLILTYLYEESAL